METSGTPAFPPDVVRSMDAGDFAAVRRSFGSADEAFAAFAAFQRARFPLDSAAGGCCGCGGVGDVRVAQASWDYSFPSVGATARTVFSAFGHVHSDHHRHGKYSTFHPVCTGCWRRWWAWRGLGSVVLVPGALGAALGGVFAVLGTVFYFGGTFRPSERAQLPTWIALGTAAVVAGIVLWVPGLRWRIPPPLRRAGHRPVTLEKLRRRPIEDWAAEGAGFWSEGA